MGKRAGKFKPKVHGYKKIKNQWAPPTIAQENSLFREYYELQLKLSPQEFEIFWSLMKQKLPVVFRINPSCPNYAAFRDKIQHSEFLNTMIQEKQMDVEEVNEGKHEPKQTPKIQILPWYPGNVLHQINTTKQIFKKSKILNNLHKFLQKAFDAGLIARQQLVSMLPPLFLDVQPTDIILDVCAAPGSKTSQLLEMLYGSQRNLKKGCVIANDADYSRAQMLIHQINRSGTAGMAVINHPGQFLPQLYTTKINHIKQKFQFDKILCDVPCSGDGATRKLPIKWSKWHTSDGISLHPLQLSILMKSINQLKRGGLIVYSTCSLNPIQNEAVLSGLLKKVAKGLQLIDIHERYNIKGRRGMPHWQVCGVETVNQIITENGSEIQTKVKKIKVYKSFEQVKGNHRIKQSMFPPTEVQKMNLDYSMRILPHDQNSGGFFIALLKKHDNFEWLYEFKKNNNILDENEEKNQEKLEEEFFKVNMPQVENIVAVEDDQNCEKNQKQLEQEIQEQQIQQREHGNDKDQKINQQTYFKGKKSKQSLKYEKFSHLNQEQFESIQKFFGLDPALKELLFIREIDGTAKRKVLLVSEGVQRYLAADRQKKIKLVNMGCKVFEKGKQSFAGYQCLYRLSQEGIHFILPYMSERKVRVTIQFFKSVLPIHSLMHDDIKDNNIRQKIRQMTQGSFCVYIDEVIEGEHIVDALVGQNFKNSFHLMVGKDEIASLNLRYL